MKTEKINAEKDTGLLPEYEEPNLSITEVLTPMENYIIIETNDVDSFLDKINKIRDGRVVEFMRLQPENKRNLRIRILNKNPGTRRL